jgi:hypothetical protein
MTKECIRCLKNIQQCSIHRFSQISGRQFLLQLPLATLHQLQAARPKTVFTPNIGREVSRSRFLTVPPRTISYSTFSGETYIKIVAIFHNSHVSPGLHCFGHCVLPLCSGVSISAQFIGRSLPNWACPKRKVQKSTG